MVCNVEMLELSQASVPGLIYMWNIPYEAITE